MTSKWTWNINSFININFDCLFSWNSLYIICTVNINSLISTFTDFMIGKFSLLSVTTTSIVSSVSSSITFLITITSSMILLFIRYAWHDWRRNRIGLVVISIIKEVNHFSKIVPETGKYGYLVRTSKLILKGWLPSHLSNFWNFFLIFQNSCIG